MYSLNYPNTTADNLRFTTVEASEAANEVVLQ